MQINCLHSINIVAKTALKTTNHRKNFHFGQKNRWKEESFSPPPATKKPYFYEKVIVEP